MAARELRAAHELHQCDENVLRECRRSGTQLTQWPEVTNDKRAGLRSGARLGPGQTRFGAGRRGASGTGAQWSVLIEWMSLAFDTFSHWSLKSSRPGSVSSRPVPVFGALWAAWEGASWDGSPVVDP